MTKPIIQSTFDGEPVKTGLVDRTIADIRSYIQEKRLRAGDVLPSETAIAEQLNVSRAVAREALRALAALRILEIGNGRRARVGCDRPSMISISTTRNVRRTLELRTASLAALRRTDVEAKLLQDIVAEMFELIEKPDQLMELDIQFHEVIAKASGNSLYSIIINSFRVITRQTWHIGWRSRATLENRTENIRCHDRIAQAIAAQDPARAEAAIAEHFDSAVSVLLHAGIT